MLLINIMTSLSCSDYSEKAIVVRGEETHTYKEELMQLGGKYNEHLKGGAGWIFPKKKEDKILEFISRGKKKTHASDDEEKSTSSSLLVQIKKQYGSLSHAERLNFLAEVTAALAESGTKPEPKVKPKVILKKPLKPVVTADSDIEEDDEDEKPRKRLL